MQHIFIINPTAGKVDASVALIPQIQRKQYEDLDSLLIMSREK